jgi:hypothetical protein
MNWVSQWASPGSISPLKIINGNPGEDRWHWLDKDDDGEIDPGEEFDWNDHTHVATMGDFTKKNLEGLATKSVLLSDNTNADRNNDGITTTKELFEYSMQMLYNEFFGDNDGEGLLDEDPAPPRDNNFWPNEKPLCPDSINGQTEGNIGETYAYSTFTTAPEGNDVFYCFDWGDGTSTGWLGPYGSGNNCEAYHSWTKKGEYTIRVKIRDRCFEESEWRILLVSMPKTKILYVPFLRFLQNYQILSQIYLSNGPEVEN